MQLESATGTPPSLDRPAVPSLWHRLSRLALLGLILVAWQIVSGVVLPRVDANKVLLMPPPTALVRAALELVASGDLFAHLADSLKREIMAFLAAAVIAIPMGVAMGWWKAVHDQLDPVIEVLRPIPPLAWIPLSILWFGIGDTQNEFIIFLGIFFPILINTITGVKQVEPNLIRAARSLGAGEWAVLRRVVLKAALPQIFTGIRVGFGVGWMALVAAELVGASSGLGFLINDARNVLRTDYILVGMVTIGVMGLVIDLVIRKLMRWLLPWSHGVSR